VSTSNALKQRNFHITYISFNRNNFQMNILEEPDEHTLVFEVIHVDTSFVNALRRILLSEVPTVALEYIYMWNNSSILHDEVLAHRLGLIPLNLDARLLDDIEPPSTSRLGGTDTVLEDDNHVDNDFVPTDRNTVVFRLAVSCSNPPKSDQRNRAHSVDINTHHPDYGDDEDNVVHPDAEMEAVVAEATLANDMNTRKTSTSQNIAPNRPYTKHIYSSDLTWVPQGDQEETLPPVRPIHDDILVAKLRPGQAIELEAHGRKGIGKDHAKFSPVATASYRLMPKIEILRPIYDKDAEELVHLYEPGVFDLIPTVPGIDPPNTKLKAQMINPYACTMSRNYMRHPVLEQSIRMSRISDHFIFSIESVGAYRPGILLAEALRILQRKCHALIDMIDETTGTTLPPTNTASL
jgi:DNA-directed RNA polymerases I and III subunit RPAC1